ncbi:hypothetical protein [Cohnella silvisoli]|uniref:Uncharacterized protein n=1 Tax=Cohnella silvisoli TaxID=2873699 RepID=A0ABV1KYW9_9BACL|nr:hypothetical protein [Cohnella silvisoli]MCD9024361.1 hypothetical protein [Cohnella silvisoli]
MILDPRAGTHFTGKIFVVPHALDRAVEYFGVDRAQAPMHVMDLLRKSALLDPDVIAEDGNRGRLFVYKRTAFIVAPNEDTVITLYPQQTAAAAVIDGVQRVLHAALRTAQRKEAREIKRLNVRKAELAVERAECELRRIKTTSVRVVAQMDERLTEINEEIAEIDTLIYEAKREKTTLAKGLCAYI